MAARPSWQGYLRFNLLSVPVKGYNAATGKGTIGFHLLHKKCHSRIRYKKVCPIHGEVDNDEIVSGYEVAKGQYVIVGADERGELRSEDDKAINVAAFIAPPAIDPIYYNGRTYYLVPDGKVAQKPYAVLLDAMARHDRYAVAQVVFAGRPQMAVMRPYDGLLAMSLLSYAGEVKKASAFTEDLDLPAVSAEERKLAETLLSAATAKTFDLAQYKDDYADKLAKLVEGKARGKKPAARAEEPPVINLMDALRRSLNLARRGKKGKSPGKGAAHGRKPSRRPGKRKTA
jgi:DNA end-binding protein Ku